jgi:hypothetical protein
VPDYAVIVGVHNKMYGFLFSRKTLGVDDFLDGKRANLLVVAEKGIAIV